MAKINIAEKIGTGYREFWFSTHRYLVCKGGRGSKKSTTAAMKVLWLIMKQPLTNALVIRRVFNSHKDSTFAQLKWAAENLGVRHLFKFSLSPLEITYQPTNQKILFRGMDNVMSITSITVEKGYLNIVWVEEAYQLNDESEFNKLDLSVRGELPEGYYKQFIITFNPWNEHHWLKKRFFDVEDDNILAMTTTYRCNEWLGPDDIALFEDMKVRNPRRYRIEGEGEWGIAEGQIFTNYEEREFNYREISKRKNTKAVFGLDWGYSNDETAFIAAIVDQDAKEIYVFDEHYEKAMVNSEIAAMIKYKGYAKEAIIGDSSEPKSIEELKRAGILRIKPAAKGRDSILNGIQFIQDFKIVVHPKCQNTLVELSNYVWDTKDGVAINKPIDSYNHLMDALRYAMEQIKKKELFVTDKSFYNL